MVHIESDKKTVRTPLEGLRRKKRTHKHAIRLE